jgi:hypothetical protein
MPIPDRKLRVFLCHALQDKPIVRELHQKLAAEGWIDPWLDEENLIPGQDWDMEIEKAVRDTESVVVCLSNNSVSKEGYVQHEMRLVLRIAGYKPEGTIFVIPIRLDDCKVPMRFELNHYVDFFPAERQDWAYGRLLAGLKARAETLGIQTARPQPSVAETAAEEARKQQERRELEERIRQETEARIRAEYEARAVGQIGSASTPVGGNLPHEPAAEKQVGQIASASTPVGGNLP